MPAFYASWLAQGAPGVLARRLRFGFARTLREEPLPRRAAGLASLPGQPLAAVSASTALERGSWWRRMLSPCLTVGALPLELAHGILRREGPASLGVGVAARRSAGTRQEGVEGCACNPATEIVGVLSAGWLQATVLLSKKSHSCSPLFYDGIGFVRSEPFGRFERCLFGREVRLALNILDMPKLTNSVGLSLL